MALINAQKNQRLNDKKMQSDDGSEMKTAARCRRDEVVVLYSGDRENGSGGREEVRETLSGT